MKTIGLIDNQEEIIFAFKHYLELFNLESIEFTNKECIKDMIKYLENNPNKEFDLFIIDLVLNGKTGIDVYNYLEKNSNVKKYAFFTGCDKSDPRYKEATKISNNNDNVWFYEKPTDPDNILIESGIINNE